MKTYVQIIAARGKAKRGESEEGPKESADSYEIVKADALKEIAEVLELDEADAEKLGSAIEDLVDACVGEHEPAKPPKPERE